MSLRRRPQSSWRPGLWLGLALCTVACGGTPEPHPQSAPAGDSAGGATSPSARESREGIAKRSQSRPPARRERAAERAVRQALEQLEMTRGLDPKRPVRSEVLSRAEMAERVRKQIEQEVPAHVVTGNAEVMIAFGVVPADFDYMKSLIDLMGVELAGFYDPRTSTMFLAADLDRLERGATLSHELVHALQDQHFGLGARLKHRPDQSDAQGAVHSLAEGDATSAMIDVMLKGEGRSALDIPDRLIGLQVRGAVALSQSAPTVPDILKRSVVAPYVDGVLLVHRLRRRAGWPAVDAVWNDPPETTEQLLHPEKLAAREPAVEVPIPDAPSFSSGPAVYHDVLGEQSLRLLLEEWVARPKAVEAASDWGGDRLAVYRQDHRYAVVWHLVYDDAPAADRAFVPFARGALSNGQQSAGQARAAAEEARKRARLCVARPVLGPFAIVRNDRHLVIVLGAYERRPQGSPRPVTECGPALQHAERIADSELG